MSLHVGKIVKELMEAEGLSREKAASALEVSRVTFSRMLKRPDWTFGQILAMESLLKEGLLARLLAGEPGSGFLWLPDGSGLVRLNVREWTGEKSK